MISANIYREDDRPKYRRGNRVLIGIATLNIVLFLAAKAYYSWVNWRRGQKWAKMSPQEQADHLDVVEEPSKKLLFRFVT